MAGHKRVTMKAQYCKCRAPHPLDRNIKNEHRCSSDNWYMTQRITTCKKERNKEVEMDRDETGESRVGEILSMMKTKQNKTKRNKSSHPLEDAQCFIALHTQLSCKESFLTAHPKTRQVVSVSAVPRECCSARSPRSL